MAPTASTSISPDDSRFHVTEPDKTGLKSADLAILGGENITPAAQQARGQELVTKGRAIESRNQSLLDKNLRSKRDEAVTLAGQMGSKWDKFDLNRVSIAARPNNVSILDQMISVFQNALVDLPVESPLRLLGIEHLIDALSKRFDEKGQLADLDEVVGLHREAIEMQPHHDRLDSLNNLGIVLKKRFGKTGQLANLDEAVGLRREVLGLVPTSHPNQWMMLCNLADILDIRSRRTGQFADLNEAIGLFREAHGLLPASHPERWKILYTLADLLDTRSDHPADLDEKVELLRELLRLQPDQWSSLHKFATALSMRFEKTGHIADLDEIVGAHRQALELQPVPHPEQPVCINDLARALSMRFEQTSEGADLDEAFGLLRGALRFLPASHSNRPESLNILASALSMRFGQTGQLADLDEAVRLHREALGLRPAHPDRSISLINLATVLATRFGQTSQLAELDEAISLHHEALELIPASHPLRSDSLNNLALALSKRFDQTGQPADLNEAVSLHHEALRLQPAPNPGRCISLHNLASDLFTQFRQRGDLADLDKAVDLLREALRLIPASHSQRSNLLNNLGCIHNRRFGETGQPADLDEAIVLHHEALKLRPVPHPGRAGSLGNIAHVLVKRFDRGGQVADLDDAVDLSREALLLFPAADRRVPLSNLAGVLLTRFSETGQVVDLNEAVDLSREALGLQSALYLDQYMPFINLARALSLRFHWTGHLADLDEAVRQHRAALQLLPATNLDRSLALSNLAIDLHAQFDQTDQLIDLDEAVELDREALSLQSALHYHRPDSLNNLATALLARFDRMSRPADIDEAVRLLREALELVPGTHPRLPGSLSHLATALVTRFGQTDQLADLDEAVGLHREALKLQAPSNPDRSISFNGLASALTTRFNAMKQLPDLEEAIMQCHEALELLGREHPRFCVMSTNQGEILVLMFNQTRQPRYLDDAIAAFRAAVKCESASASKRFHAACRWAINADDKHDSALEAYQSAIELLPHLATLGLDLHSRQQVLASGKDGLAQSAAACAIRSGQYTKAVELLEEGRAIFWSQALQLRTPLDDLRRVDCSLAQRLLDISCALEQGSRRDASTNLLDTERRMSIEKETAYYRNLNSNWVEAIEEVRKLNGFQDFMRPCAFSTLRNAATNGPVVILTAGGSTFAALVLTISGVQHVPLPDITAADVMKLVKSMRGLTASDVRHPALPTSGEVSSESLRQDIKRHRDALHLPSRDDRLGIRVPDIPIDSDAVFRSVLGKLWTSVAKPIIRSLKLPKSKPPSRLWWCPTGLFSFLPIHAAGIYNTGPMRAESVSDYIISSYTPTLKTLLVPPSVRNSFKMMVAIQPETPGYLSLPCTTDELCKIEARVPAEYLLKLGTVAAPASVETVCSHLSSASIAHFACHGEQNINDPLKSALVLADGQLTVSRIMELSMPNASLAFLSACQTAMGDEKLPDEAMHLAATLLFAGFSGAVATMWSIIDNDGPKIADNFYEQLFQPSTMQSKPIHPHHEIYKRIRSLISNRARKPSTSAAADALPLYPNTTEAARALHLAVAILRNENASFMRWVPFVHFGL